MYGVAITVLKAARRARNVTSRLVGARVFPARGRVPGFPGRDGPPPAEEAALPAPGLEISCRGQAASDLIRRRLLGAEPCMVARIGHTEAKAMARLRRRRERSWLVHAWRFVTSKQGVFWWDDPLRWEMQFSSGFFPCTDAALTRFAERCFRDLEAIDVLGAWLPHEAEFREHLGRAWAVPLQDLEPFFHADPWTTALAGAKVLVVHPFEASIRQQYEKRALLFADRRILPDFQLKTLRAVQSLGGHTGGFRTWFQALEWMCREIERIDFDIAIIGAGAYGLPLAAHVKRIGKKAVHLGGASQLLFGIRGRRWEERPDYRGLINEHWVRPRPEETPTGHQHVDKGKSYW